MHVLRRSFDRKRKFFLLKLLIKLKFGCAKQVKTENTIETWFMRAQAFFVGISSIRRKRNVNMRSSRSPKNYPIRSLTLFARLLGAPTRKKRDN
ncbi:hypothetical protein L596_004752 [Steinernema carpocapsae]|uniref:Uncharacterized protein n=1 Tax=Steinernema carpocapsae TaxID=34508 RepID=A0A4U8V0C8_STECR|nr:hypothetical protein L596_004752 [Steinernema carpocapsae]